MKAYSYDEITKEYLNAVECQLDPLESKKQKKDVYLLPANSTHEEIPTCKEDQVIIFNTNKWEIIDDIRKKVFYSKETSQKIIVNLNDDITELTELEPCEFPKWDGKKWVKDKDKEKEYNLYVAKNELKSLDIEVSRPLEDIYEVLTDEQKAAINQDTKDKIIVKQAKRKAYVTLLNKKI